MEGPDDRRHCLGRQGTLGRSNPLSVRRLVEPGTSAKQPSRRPGLPRLLPHHGLHDKVWWGTSR